MYVLPDFSTIIGSDLQAVSGHQVFASLTELLGDSADYVGTQEQDSKARKLVSPSAGTTI
jgi:hypothetical protein